MNNRDVFSRSFYQFNVLRERRKHAVNRAQRSAASLNSDIWLEVKNENLICTAVFVRFSDFFL